MRRDDNTVLVAQFQVARRVVAVDALVIVHELCGRHFEVTWWLTTAYVHLLNMFRENSTAELTARWQRSKVETDCPVLRSGWLGTVSLSGS